MSTKKNTKENTKDILRYLNPKFFCALFSDLCDIKSESNCAYCLSKLRKIPPIEDLSAFRHFHV